MCKRKALIALLLLSTMTASCASESGDSPLVATLAAAPDTPDRSMGIMYNDFQLLAKEEGLRRLSRSAGLAERVAWYVAIQSRVLYGLPLGGSRETWGFDITEISTQATVSGLSIVSGDLDTDALVRKLQDHGYQEEQYRGVPLFLWTPQVAEEVRNVFPGAIAVLEGGPQAALVSMVPQGYQSLWEAEAAVKQSIDAHLDGDSLADNEDLAEAANLLADYPSAFFCSSAFLTDKLGAYPALPSAPGLLEPWSMLAIGNRQEDDRSLLLFVLTFDTAGMAENNVEAVRDRLAEGRVIAPPGPLSDILKIQSVEVSGRQVLATVELIGEAAANDSFFTHMIYNLDLGFLQPGQAGSG